MTLIDAITWMQQRPGFAASLGGYPIIGLSSTGYIMRLDRPGKTYWRPNAMQCLAITWEVYTVEQLKAAAAAARAGDQGAAGEVHGNG